MPTPFPPIDLTGDIVSDIRESFEQRYLANIGSEELEKGVAQEFNEFAFRPFARKVMALATSPEWNLGCSKTEVARKLGMERTRGSDAQRHGEMRLGTFIAISYGKRRPKKVYPSYEEIDAMNRAGFIAVVKYLASFVDDRPSLAPSEMNELRYELLCEMLFDLHDWSLAQLTKDGQYCIDLIKTVVTGKHVIPEWYSAQEASEAREFIKQNTGSNDAAFNFLAQLYRDWSDIFICGTFQIDEADLQYSVDPEVRDGD
jgi:hypothetical protein